MLIEAVLLYGCVDLSFRSSHRHLKILTDFIFIVWFETDVHFDASAQTDQQRSVNVWNKKYHFFCSPWHFRFVSTIQLHKETRWFAEMDAALLLFQETLRVLFVVSSGESDWSNVKVGEGLKWQLSVIWVKQQGEIRWAKFFPSEATPSTQKLKSISAGGMASTHFAACVLKCFSRMHTGSDLGLDYGSILSPPVPSGSLISLPFWPILKQIEQWWSAQWTDRPHKAFVDSPINYTFRQIAHSYLCKLIIHYDLFLLLFFSNLSWRLLCWLQKRSISCCFFGGLQQNCRKKRWKWAEFPGSDFVHLGLGPLTKVWAPQPKSWNLCRSSLNNCVRWSFPASLSENRSSSELGIYLTIGQFAKIRHKLWQQFASVWMVLCTLVTYFQTPSNASPTKPIDPQTTEIAGQLSLVWSERGELGTRTFVQNRISIFQGPFHKLQQTKLLLQQTV